MNNVTNGLHLDIIPYSNILGSSVEHGGRIQPIRRGDGRLERKPESRKHKLDENSGLS